MASNEAVNKQCLAYIKDIESMFEQLTGEPNTGMRRQHRDPYLLRRDQLQFVRDWLSRVPKCEDVDATPDTRLQDAIALVESGNWTKSAMESVLLGDTDGDVGE